MIYGPDHSMCSGPVLSVVPVRYAFRAESPVCFDRAANHLRGALGLALRSRPELHSALFAPRGGPGSGYRDAPRGFVIRASPLDGKTFEPGEHFGWDLLLFGSAQAHLPHITEVFAEISSAGMGIRRGRAHLIHSDAAAPVAIEPRLPAYPVQRTRIEFLTPTELKNEGGISSAPKFRTLYARLRDRLRVLATLYGNWRESEWPEPAREDAAAVRIAGAELRHAGYMRRSTRTGYAHPVGGYVGTVEYEGELTAFLPWLQAGEWIHAGRQTVWGNGQMRVEIADAAAPIEAAAQM